MDGNMTGTSDNDQKKRSRVTIVDVANSAGVHISTASRALNPTSRHRISSKVVKKIEKVAQQLGYKPNTLASSLRTQKSGTIGLVVPSLSDPLFGPIIASIEERVAKDGYITFVASSDYKPDKLVSIIERMGGQYVAGLIVASFELNDPSVELCLKSGIPTVAVLRDPRHSLISSVAMDDSAGVQALVEHVLDLGHKDIVYITPPLAASTAQNRLAGFRAAARLERAHGCRFDVIEARAYDVAEGERIMRQMLAAGLKSTAVLAFNDLLAVGCLIALKSAGIACPEQISLTGINDLRFMDLLSPPLTSLHTAGRDLGFESAELLMSLISNHSQPVKRVLLTPHMIVRGTTGPAPAPNKADRLAPVRADHDSVE
ncbi:LacI family DNA-binding transcriptional regulator (plasmid) [Rhizobium indicum]|uniref:LacI family DNA-binding transcriptional regulator n=1 Tax=Rhizobium indicum TaxID=2583231 RepID=UPI0011058FC8|nr:LacI family DNA-binding transcriptional regulator [Rhizobium indicum]QKK33255.1 LacI family DNA-binding transcriptional regulator [Rhizobium indicum]